MNTKRAVRLGLASVLAGVVGGGSGQGGEEELQAGRVYEAGARLRSSPMGVSIAVPREWRGAVQGPAAFALGSNTKPGLGLVIPQVGAGPEDVVAYLESPHDLGGGVIARPLGPAKRAGNRVSQRYEAGPYTSQAVSVLGPDTNGVTFILTGPPSEERAHGVLLGELASSVRFSPPQAAGVVAQWNQNLRGKRLYLYDFKKTGNAKTGTDSTREATWHLCGDGRYTSSANFQSSINVNGEYGSGADAVDYRYGSAAVDGGRDGGRWKVVVMGALPVLVLRSSSGRWFGHALWFDGRSVLVDGSSVQVGPSDQCR